MALAARSSAGAGSLRLQTGLLILRNMQLVPTNNDRTIESLFHF